MMVVEEKEGEARASRILYRAPSDSGHSAKGNRTKDRGRSVIEWHGASNYQASHQPRCGHAALQPEDPCTGTHDQQPSRDKASLWGSAVHKGVACTIDTRKRPLSSCICARRHRIGMLHRMCWTIIREGGV